MTAPAGGGLNPDSAIARQALLTKVDRTIVFLLVRAPRSNPIAHRLMPQNRRRGEGGGATTLTRETRRRSGVDEKCNQERLVEQKTLRGPHSGKTIPR
jgi:hypothetical protein